MYLFIFYKKFIRGTQKFLCDWCKIVLSYLLTQTRSIMTDYVVKILKLKLSLRIEKIWWRRAQGLHELFSFSVIGDFYLLCIVIDILFSVYTRDKHISRFSCFAKFIFRPSWIKYFSKIIWAFLFWFFS